MWQIEYSEEAKYYFVDNDPYAFDVLIRIEELKYSEDGIPQQDCVELEPDFFWWEVLQHAVLFERIDDAPRKLVIQVIKPL